MPVRPGENVVQDLLVWLRGHLQSDPWYAEHGAPILIENNKDILYELENVLNGKLGIALILKAPRAENNRPALNVTLELLAVASPTLNRTRANSATALDVAWHAALALDVASAMLRFVEHIEEGPLFKARAQLDRVINRCPSPLKGKSFTIHVARSAEALRCHVLSDTPLAFSPLSA